MKTVTIAALIALAAAACSTTEERVGGAAVGAVTGAAVAGPVGAAAGGAAGALVAPRVVDEVSRPRRRGR